MQPLQSRLFYSTCFLLCFELQQRNQEINYLLAWWGRGVHLYVCVWVCVWLCWPRSTQDIQGQNFVCCSDTKVKDDLFQPGRPEISQYCAESFSFWFISFRKWMKVWSVVRRWTSFPPLSLLLLLWSSNSGCVSRLSGINIVAVPQNQPCWIMSRALCEMRLQVNRHSMNK